MVIACSAPEAATGAGAVAGFLPADPAANVWLGTAGGVAPACAVVVDDPARRMVCVTGRCRVPRPAWVGVREPCATGAPTNASVADRFGIADRVVGINGCIAGGKLAVSRVACGRTAMGRHCGFRPGRFDPRPLPYADEARSARTPQH